MDRIFEFCTTIAEYARRIDGFTSIDWLLLGLALVLAGPVAVQISMLAMRLAKRNLRRFLAYLWREFLEWLADKVFGWLMAAVVALVVLWGSGLWGA